MAVFGLGGVGKTQLALEFAYRTKDRTPGVSIFWVPATDSLAFEQAYIEIGRACNVPGIDAKGIDVKQLVKDALSHKNMGPWLMIIDNADDTSVVFRQPVEGGLFSPALADYLPSSPDGSVLFTTRNRKIAVKQASSNIICLEMMGPDEAQDLLKRSVVDQDVVSDDAANKELLNLLGFLPLAIIQAAAYINQNDTTIDEYTSLYDDNETEVMKVLSEDFEPEGRYQASKNSIATTWLISLSQINRTNPTAIEILSFMACLTNQNIPQTLLPPIPSKKLGLEAIGALKSYSFIKKRKDSNDFDIHRLVHLATRNWLRSEGKLHVWVDKAIARLGELLPAGGHKDRSTWTAYLPHANHLLDASEHTKVGLNMVVLAEKLGQCLYSNGEYYEAQRAFERAISLRDEFSGLENRDALWSMFGLAEALNHQGKHKLAECHHREILELRKKVLGPKDPEVGRSMNYLAQALYDGGDYFEAEKWHREARALQIEVLHLEHPNTLTTTGYLAQTLGKQGKYQEAEEMHRALLETRLRVQGEEYPGTLATMSCHGVAQGDLGNHADAERIHRRVLSLRLKILGRRHPHTLITQRWLADALLRQGKYDDAYTLNQDTLKVQMETLGPKHPNTLLTLGNLGDILLFQGKPNRAEPVYRQALALQSEVIGREHPETLDSMYGLAKSLEKQPGKEGEARDFYQRTLDSRMKVLGQEHRKTLETRRCLSGE
jgi:tetratricopeptide (TPR) repeat protein